MNLDFASFFVRRWQFTLVLFTLLALLGVNALVSIPRSEDPQFPMPVVLVRAVLPGASPIDVEQLIAKPIEDAIAGLDDVKSVRSSSRDGVTVVRVEFSWRTNPDRKYDEVVREVNALRPALPQGLTQLEVRRARTTEVAIVQLALVSGDLPARRLEKLARRLRDDLNRVPGVREARYWGLPDSELRVELDLGRLAQLQLPPSVAVDALRTAGAEIPVGAAHAGDRRFNIRPKGPFRDEASVGAVVVANRDGQVVRVRDVATVGWRDDEPNHLARFNGERAVFVTATQKDGADVLRITKDVEATVLRFRETLPPGVRLETAFEQAASVRTRLHHLNRDFMIALGLVMLTLSPLGVRAGLVVAVSLPLSLLIGLAGLQAFGFSLNQLSIAGFILALGLVVDDSIVVTENISRRMRQGEDRLTASINGVRQIALAVAGCTATLMLAFVPLLALPGAAGAYIKSLPVTVLCTVGASFVVALTIIPFLASRLLRPEADMEGNRLLRAVNRVIHLGYRPILARALERPRTTVALLGVVCLATIPVVGAVGTSLFPPAETPHFLVQIELEEGAALSGTEKALNAVEAELRRTPGISGFAGNLGRGNPQVYYNVNQHEPDAGYAEVLVTLPEWRRGESDQLIAHLRSVLKPPPGARIRVLTFENGSYVEAPVVVRITGEDLRVLKALAMQAERVMRGTHGLRDVSNPLRLDRTDIVLGVDEARAAALGVPTGAAERVARLALTGEDPARFRDPDGQDYPVRVRMPMSTRNNVGDLERVFVSRADGAAVALGSIATPGFVTSAARIDRYDRQRMATVTARVEGDQLVSAATAQLAKSLEKALVLPPGYALAFGGQVEAQSESLAGLGAALLIAILGILAVLVLEFGRFRTALVVAAIIPLGLFGAVTALWIGGYSLSFTATIGVVALIGIEIKNSILLVDFTEQLRADGVPIRRAIEQAGETRFLPVLLTSITAIGGLLPLALSGSGLYAPLAVAIIGGLISSTLLSRLATPTLYLLLQDRDPSPADAAPEGQSAT